MFVLWGKVRVEGNFDVGVYFNPPTPQNGCFYLMKRSFEFFFHGQRPFALVFKADSERVDLRPLVAQEPIQILGTFLLLLKTKQKLINEKVLEMLKIFKIIEDKMRIGDNLITPYKLITSSK